MLLTSIYWNWDTPLIVASKYGNLEMVKILIINYPHINIEHKNKNGEDALWWANKNGHLKITKILKSHISKFNKKQINVNNDYPQKNMVNKILSFFW